MDDIVQLDKTCDRCEMEIIDKIEAIGICKMDIGSWDKAAVFRREVLMKRQKILGDEDSETI